MGEGIRFGNVARHHDRLERSAVGLQVELGDVLTVGASRNDVRSATTSTSTTRSVVTRLSVTPILYSTKRRLGWAELHEEGPPVRGRLKEWTQTLKSMAVLGRTSIARFTFRNLVLLVSQRPEIHHAATFQAWRALGRSVRKGEKALHVLKPRFAKRATATQAADEADKQLVGFSVLPLFALEQSGEEALRRRVVPAVSLSTHAADAVVVAQSLSVVDARVLHAAVGLIRARGHS